MKTAWQTRKLADVCTISAGNSAPQKKEFFVDGMYPFIRTSDVGAIHIGTIEESNDYLNEAGINKMKLHQKGTVLFPKSGASTFSNHRVIMGIDAYVSSHLATIKSIESILEDRFLFYFLQTVKAQDLIQDHRYPSLNLPVIGGITISFPDSLEEQRHIIGKLDGVFEKVKEAKEAAEKNLRNSQDLFDAYLESVFQKPTRGWQEKTLADVCKISSKLIDPREKDYINLIHVGAGNIESGSGNLIELKTAKEEKLVSGKFLFDKRMVLYSKIRPYLMKVVRPNFDGLCSADIYPLLPNESILNRDYLYYLLLTPEFTKYAILGSGRAGMPKVNREHLFAYAFFLPPLSEQNTIVSNLDTLSVETKKLKAIYEEKLADLEELKSSVLNMAFSGELSPVVSPIQVSQTSVAVPSPYIRNQVHAAIIDQVVRDNGSTTEVAVAKYDHLLQELFGVSLGYQFATHQFGPFDAQIKRLVSSGLGRNKWFAKRRGMIVLGSNVSALLSRQSNLYRSAQTSMKELSRLGITKMNTDGIELLSTVSHSIKETGSIAIDAIRDFMSQWQTDNNTRTKAEKFSVERTQKCIDFIISNNLQQRLLPTP